MKCKPGDLAVVLSAHHKSNVGRFVSVIELYASTDGAKLDWASPVWLVESNAPLMWTRGKGLWIGNKGPVPDSALQPIQGLSKRDIQASRLPMKKELRNDIE
jgi:hypothetical protein